MHACNRCHKHLIGDSARTPTVAHTRDVAFRTADAGVPPPSSSLLLPPPPPTPLCSQLNPDTPLFCVGFSLGAGILAKYIAEDGEALQGIVTAAVACCGSYDMVSPGGRGCAVASCRTCDWWLSSHRPLLLPPEYLVCLWCCLCARELASPHRVSIAFWIVGCACEQVKTTQKMEGWFHALTYNKKLASNLANFAAVNRHRALVDPSFFPPQVPCLHFSLRRVLLLSPLRCQV